MAHRVFIAPLIAFLLPAACVTGPVQISSEPLAGKVGGADWVLASAESDPFLSANTDTFFVAAYAEALAPCTRAGSASSGNQLILSVPKVAGDYPLNSALRQTFYVPASNINYVATQGRILVEEVTATTIRAGAHFRFDDANAVDGQFTVTICP